MSKLLYINLDFNRYKNKALAQLDAFEKLNISSDLATIENNNDNNYFALYKYDNNKLSLKYKKLLNKSNNSKNLIKLTFNKINSFIKLRKYLISYYNDNSIYDYCYIRRIGTFIFLFKKMFKVLSKNSKILYEIPTYPFDKFDSMILNLCQSFESFYYNKFIDKYVDTIPVIVQSDVKLSDKMIPMFNGVKWDNYVDISEKIPEFEKTLNLVIIANITSWHGYDRLIKSLAEYKGKYKINIDIFSGDNLDCKKLKDLVKQYNLENNTSFKGKKNLEDIIKDIEKYHIAVGSLGYHRRNGKYDTSIKNKEYCAMGLPIICSTEDKAFPGNYKYIFKVSPDDSNFNIDDIISWYVNIRKNNYKKEMRNYAKNNLCFEKSYKEVFKDEK